jgi:hypothetical protein
VGSQTNLLQIVSAGRTTSGFSSLLNSRQKKTDKNANDGDDNEKLNKRKSTLLSFERSSHKKFLQKLKNKKSFRD